MMAALSNGRSISNAKKPECCRLKTDTIQNIPDGQFELEIQGSSKGKVDHGSNASNSKPYFPLLNDGAK